MAVENPAPFSLMLATPFLWLGAVLLRLHADRLSRRQAEQRDTER
jgi:hypothetical protein